MEKLDMLLNKKDLFQRLYDKSMDEIDEIESKIREINDQVSGLEKEYIIKENTSLIKKIIWFNIIPCLSMGLILLLSGQSEFISNMGGFGLNLTGIPTTLISLGIYLKNKKGIIDKFSRDYRRSEEYMDLYEKSFNLGKEKNIIINRADSLKEMIDNVTKQINYLNNITNYANGVADIFESELDVELDNSLDDVMVKRLK